MHWMPERHVRLPAPLLTAVTFWNLGASRSTHRCKGWPDALYNVYIVGGGYSSPSLTPPITCLIHQDEIHYCDLGRRPRKLLVDWC